MRAEGVVGFMGPGPEYLIPCKRCGHFYHYMFETMAGKPEGVGPNCYMMELDPRDTPFLEDLS